MRQWKSTLRKALSKALHNARGRSRLSAEVSRLYRCQTKIRYVSELTQQDGRAKKAANLVWQEWQYKFCLNKENLPQISPSFKNDQNTLLVKITTKHASNSPVTCVTHKRFVVLTDYAGPMSHGPIGNVVPRVLSCPSLGTRFQNRCYFSRFHGFYLFRGALDSRDGRRRCRKENSFWRRGLLLIWFCFHKQSNIET